MENLNPEAYYKHFISHFKRRHDGRDFADARPIEITTGCYHSADASALVKIGDAMATCGIRIELLKRTEILFGSDADQKQGGLVVVGLDATSRCSNTIRPGQSEMTVEAQACQERLQVLLSETVDLQQLRILDQLQESHLQSSDNLDYDLVMVLYVDIYSLCDESALLDICLMSVMAALASLKLPQFTLIDSEEDNGQSDIMERLRLVQRNAVPLRLLKHPVAVTFVIFNSDRVLADPSKWELERCSAESMTFVIDSMSGKQMHFWKFGTAELEYEEYLTAAKRRAGEVYQATLQ